MPCSSAGDAAADHEFELAEEPAEPGEPEPDADGESIRSECESATGRRFSFSDSFVESVAGSADVCAPPEIPSPEQPARGRLKENPFTSFQAELQSSEKEKRRLLRFTDESILAWRSRAKSENCKLRLWKRTHEEELHDMAKLYTSYGIAIHEKRLGADPPKTVPVARTVDDVMRMARDLRGSGRRAERARRDPVQTG